MLSKHYNGHEAITDLLRETIKGNHSEKDKYGVHLDEYANLAGDEDPFDCAEDSGPNPPILDECMEPQVFCTVPIGDNDDAEKQIEILNLAYNMVRPGYTVIMYGPRRSGKSMLIKHLCQRLRPYFPDVVCFTRTKDSGEYFGFLPYDNVIQGLDEDLLLDLLMHQASLKKAETRGEDMGNYNLLVIIDDCMAEKLRYKDIFNMVFFNGRHYNVTLIVTVQDVKGVAPAATINADIAFSFALPDRRGRDTIREKFADYLSRDQFNSLFDSPELNKKYHVIGFDIAHRYNPIDRRISVGCVDQDTFEPYVMGNRKMWQGHEDQLKDLGMEHLLVTEDWGIIQPKKQNSKK